MANIERIIKDGLSLIDSLEPRKPQKTIQYLNGVLTDGENVYNSFSEIMLASKAFPDTDFLLHDNVTVYPGIDIITEDSVFVNHQLYSWETSLSNRNQYIYTWNNWVKNYNNWKTYNGTSDIPAYRMIDSHPGLWHNGETENFLHTIQPICLTSKGYWVESLWSDGTYITHNPDWDVKVDSYSQGIIEYAKLLDQIVHVVDVSPLNIEGVE